MSTSPSFDNLRKTKIIRANDIISAFNYCKLFLEVHPDKQVSSADITDMKRSSAGTPFDVREVRENQ